MNIQKIRLELVKLAIDKCASPSAIPEIVEPLAQYVLNGNDKYTKHADECDKKYAEALLRMIQQRFGQQSAFSVKVDEHAFVMNVSDAFKNLIEMELKGPQAPDWIRGRRVELHVMPPKKPQVNHV